MAQTSGFFESEIDESGSYDRVYYAEQFAHYFSLFVGNGVFFNPTDQLQVVALQAQSMSVLVKTGNAFINGYWFRSTENEEIELAPASGVYSRYDAIVAGYNSIDREIKIYVKQGSYSENPVKPQISKTNDLYELCLAYVLVDANAVEITADKIEDTRPYDNLCGFVEGLVKQISSDELFIQYNAIFTSWYDSVKQQVYGIVNNISENPEGALQGFTLIFNSWFDTIKNKLGSDPATKLAEQIMDLEKRMYGFEGKTTSFLSDGSIMERYNSGLLKMTTFNSDGSIEERFYDNKSVLLYYKKTTFLEDGNIKEEVN